MSPQSTTRTATLDLGRELHFSSAETAEVNLTPVRHCECGTRLSRFNRFSACAACQENGRIRSLERVACSRDGCVETAVKDSEGARSSRLRNLCAEHYDAERELVLGASRTTDGGLALPAAIVIRPVRSIAEMLAKPPAAAARTCSECGKPIPIARHGWLCATCLPAEGVERTRALKPEKAKVKRPNRQPRSFDWEAAGRLYEAGSSYRQVAAHFGVQKSTAVHAVHVVLGAERASEIARERNGGGNGPRRRFDHSAAADLWLEVGSYSEVARRMSVSDASARKAVQRELARRVVAA